MFIGLLSHVARAYRWRLQLRTLGQNPTMRTLTNAIFGTDGVHHIAANGDALHQNRIDRHAYQNQHTLKANGQQGLEIVGAHAAKLPVDAGGKWDRCKARQK